MSVTTAVTNLAITPVPGALDLAWDVNTDIEEELTGFEIATQASGSSSSSWATVRVGSLVRSYTVNTTQTLVVRVRAVAQAFGGAQTLQGTPQPVVVSSVQAKLSADKTFVEITDVPTKATTITVALSASPNGPASSYAEIPATQTTYRPSNGLSAVSMIARENEAYLGSWTGWMVTVAPAASMTKAVDVGAWSGIFGDVAGSVKAVRLPGRALNAQKLSELSSAGVRVASMIFGEKGTIGSIVPSTYAQEVIKPFQEHGKVADAVEVLNEPGGSWFWSDPTNYTAYVRLLKAVWEAVKTLPEGSRPKVLASWDGGGSNSTFGEGVKAAGGMAYCDGVTVHPYGGSNGQDGGANGNRMLVEQAHARSGKPVYVTEVGWPTATGQKSTGDSQQWTEQQQAINITAFVKWARSTGYVPLVVIFNFVDYGTNWYGIEHENRTHKASYAALAAA